MANVQGEANIGNTYSSSKLSSPHLITNLETAYHHSCRLTTSSSVWKVVDSQVLPFLSLHHQGSCSNSILNPAPRANASEGLSIFCSSSIDRLPRRLSSASC
ncbi:hypothetical protein CR513_17883, partial [Mucuna pruriens]